MGYALLENVLIELKWRVVHDVVIFVFVCGRAHMTEVDGSEIFGCLFLVIAHLELVSAGVHDRLTGQDGSLNHLRNVLAGAIFESIDDVVAAVVSDKEAHVFSSEFFECCLVLSHPHEQFL